MYVLSINLMKFNEREIVKININLKNLISNEDIYGTSSIIPYIGYPDFF